MIWGRYPRYPCRVGGVMDDVTRVKAESPTVSSAVYGRIRADILCGSLPPGMKLKLENLRQTYDVSINTLRETLSRLAADGLVEAEGQRGFNVIPASFSDLVDITETRR